VCDPHPLCISRFSRFVRRYYRCPAVGTDPLGYLAFVLQHLTQDPYDVLLPVHEQAFLFAKVRDQLPDGVSTALASFDAFLQVQGKVAFARLMERLSLPQPPTRIVSSRAELEILDRFPSYLKTAYSTAGQGSGASRTGWSGTVSRSCSNSGACSVGRAKSSCRKKRPVRCARRKPSLLMAASSPCTAPGRGG